MKFITADEAPVFDIPGATFTGLAAPSRGARETAAWRVTVPAGTPPHFHRVTREEIFLAVAGRAMVHTRDGARELAAGGCVIVPADTEFALANPFAEPFDAAVVLPVGGEAVVDGAPFVPPWAA